ncbi:hypothetical protein HUJ04_011602 [Dendroctonus ponderosae]|nr:hypothetical protein HUJ04_011602 [Dendroctonus ponderosae]
MKIVILFISFALFVTRIEAKKKNSTTTTASGQLASFHETSTLPGAKKKKPTKSTKSKHLHIIIIASRIPGPEIKPKQVLIDAKELPCNDDNSRRDRNGDC